MDIPLYISPTSSLAILGAGSIGLLLASLLRKYNPNYPLRLLLRSSRRGQCCYGDKLSKKKLSQYHCRFSPSITFNDNTCSSNESYIMTVLHDSSLTTILDLPIDSSSTPLNNILLTTKANDAKGAILSILSRLTKDSHIILACNGVLSVLNDIQSILPPAVALSTASLTHGAYCPCNRDTQRIDNILGPCQHVRHTGKGRIVICCDILPTKPLNSIIVTRREITNHHWQKLAFNSVINSLTALKKCTNGELLSQLNMEATKSKKIIYSYDDSLVWKWILEEVIQVANQECSTYMTLEKTKQGLMEVIKCTSSNYSSMVQDIQCRRRTEVEFLNGYVAMLGKEKYRLKMRTNEWIWKEIEKLQERNESN